MKCGLCASCKLKSQLFSMIFIQVMYVGHITKDISLYEEQKNYAMLVTNVHIGTTQLTSLNVSSVLHFCFIIAKRYFLI